MTTMYMEEFATLPEAKDYQKVLMGEVNNKREPVDAILPVSNEASPEAYYDRFELLSKFEPLQFDDMDYDVGGYYAVRFATELSNGYVAVGWGQSIKHSIKSLILCASEGSKMETLYRNFGDPDIYILEPNAEKDTDKLKEYGDKLWAEVGRYQTSRAIPTTDENLIQKRKEVYAQELWSGTIEELVKHKKAKLRNAVFILEFEDGCIFVSKANENDGARARVMQQAWLMQQFEKGYCPSGGRKLYTHWLKIGKPPIVHILGAQYKDPDKIQRDLIHELHAELNAIA